MNTLTTLVIVQSPCSMQAGSHSKLYTCPHSMLMSSRVWSSLHGMETGPPLLVAPPLLSMVVPTVQGRGCVRSVGGWGHSQLDLTLRGLLVDGRADNATIDNRNDISSRLKNSGTLLIIGVSPWLHC